ncbi:MAG: SLC13 family permease [Alphaproteobacteria bacterium]
MTFDQAAVFAILFLAMCMFIWGRIRYDLVAFGALMLATVLNLVPVKEAFSGLGNPAVITVAMVLIISKSIQDSGALSYLAKPLSGLMDKPLLFMAAIMLVGAVLSGFMNNVGALALLMPLALQAKISPGLILMPLSFGTILGGLTTLIGTPPNIVVAQYREELTGKSFGLFSFAPVGAVAAVVGCIFILVVGWRLIPKRKDGENEGTNLFQIDEYITEVLITEESEAAGKALYSLEKQIEGEIHIVGLIRNQSRMLGNLRLTKLMAGDLLLIRAHTDSINELVSLNGIELAAEDDDMAEILKSEDVAVVEAVVTPGSRAEGRTPRGLFMRARYALNLLAISRQGKAFVPRLQNIRFVAGDVVLVQGDRTVMSGSLRELGLLPLAKREIKLGSDLSFLPLIIFGAAILLTAFGLLPVYISFALAVIAMIACKQIEPKRIYETIDWPIVVLLASMIPIGSALQSTGGTVLVANSVANLSNVLSPLLLLTLVLVVTMTLSDVMNNAATAVVMAPIAASVATQLGHNPDPFLMAVAVGASCAFLTPIGHQNNLLVMGPGGYKFGDYWRMGLPLEVIVVAITVPLIALVWPL